MLSLPLLQGNVINLKAFCKNSWVDVGIDPYDKVRIKNKMHNMMIISCRQSRLLLS